MRVLFCLCLMMFLSSCATGLGNFRERAITKSFSVDGDYNHVSDCIALSLSQLDSSYLPPMNNQIVLGDMVSLGFVLDNRYWWVADVYRQDGGVFVDLNAVRASLILSADSSIQTLEDEIKKDCANFNFKGA